MSTRRDFIVRALATGGAITLGSLGVPKLTIGDARSTPAQALKRLRILVLGGTGFVGPHFVRAAMEKGHRVSVFSRGKSEAELPTAVEKLLGDRDGDLESIKNRDWDAVIDSATYRPAWVRSLSETLKGRVEHYTFISGNAVYDDPSANRVTSEDSRLREYTWSDDPYTLTTVNGFEQYGALKLLCEREAEKQFPGRTLVLRPSMILGPGGFSLPLFWMDRMGRGGHMLAAGDPSMPIQFIDVRDIAEWIVRMIENGGTGVYNTMGPASAISCAHMFDAMSGIVTNSPKITWVPGSWLAARNDGGTWNLLIRWATATASMRMSAKRALAHGLRLRPMKVTLADSFNWYKTQSAEEQARVFLGAKREDGSVMTWPVYLDHEKQLLAAWHDEQSKGSQTG